MKKKEVKIQETFYNYLNCKLWKFSKTKIIKEKDIKKYIFKSWKLPKELIPLIIKELELLNLIKKRKRYTYEILKPKIEEENFNEYYIKLGFY